MVRQADEGGVVGGSRAEEESPGVRGGLGETGGERGEEALGGVGVLCGDAQEGAMRARVAVRRTEAARSRALALR